MHSLLHDFMSLGHYCDHLFPRHRFKPNFSALYSYPVKFWTSHTVNPDVLMYKTSSLLIQIKGVFFFKSMSQLGGKCKVFHYQRTQQFIQLIYYRVRCILCRDLILKRIHIEFGWGNILQCNNLTIKIKYLV